MADDVIILADDLSRLGEFRPGAESKARDEDRIRGVSEVMARPSVRPDDN
jgi:hypothetical protein